ncbi:kinase-like protein [Xylona heveae TC161]|uniref:Kinase-like protein n=1 Tax=Xylona heveae (strain CBS 132557 / TC161) TaxID=1328760 RepID=A0A165JEY0_XYLHT|nr:kinase-like protein [Xylona heveae TC161]KZF26148.1 kinase-like protein [Xylona heveae TC161]
MFIHQDGTPIRDPIIGMGGSGVVIRQENIAVKLPLICTEDESTRNGWAVEIIEREKDVYRRLGECDGVVSCLDLSGPGIQMELMELGNLREYLQQHRPSKLLQLSWFKKMAHTLALIHGRRVIVADISSRNLLLATDLSIKFSDFTESSILPLDTDMSQADDSGYSIHTDIGQFGTVMYEVITGTKCQFNLHEDAESRRAQWPSRERLPATKSLWLGDIIDRCWSEKSFKDTWELSTILAAIDLDQTSPDKATKVVNPDHTIFRKAVHSFKQYWRCIMSVATAALIWLRKSFW